jgi:hypothetical protein
MNLIIQKYDKYLGSNCSNDGLLQNLFEVPKVLFPKVSFTVEAVLEPLNERNLIFSDQ